MVRGRAELARIQHPITIDVEKDRLARKAGLALVQDAVAIDVLEGLTADDNNLM